VKLPDDGINGDETCSNNVRLCLFTQKVHLLLGMNNLIQLKSKKYIMSEVQFSLMLFMGVEPGRSHRGGNVGERCLRIGC
jgi:hypothetical protein